ncbi:uncharacterized protein LOC128336657 [Hemicordylus capensis]|uniref:uncharacterized protein LOC128336657 n=1 Tax=Hemicordylus capensis TaxID=884348 RepID=UPI002303F69A|nr:uncharacterized protein LOC128336657 [Hemicordylus capensis]
MSLKRGLYECPDPACWRAVLNVYGDAITAKGMKQKNLIALDRWYQEELPGSVTGRKEKYLTREELVKLMEWKLARGKFRPRLQQLVATNSSETVEVCTKRSFQLLPDTAAAITELSKLKAVGPATASAILAAGAPEVAAFMADEAVGSIPGLSPIQYTLKHYLLYLDRIRGCAQKLSEADPEKTWTPHCVEKCLWAWAVAEKLNLPLLKTLYAEDEKVISNGAADTQPRKKQRRR